MHTSQINAVEQTLENIKSERPVYSEMVDLFGPLFRAQSQLAEELSNEMKAPQVDAGKLSQGAHVLATLDLEPWTEEFLQCAKTLQPILLQILPQEWRDNIPGDFFSDDVSLLKLAKTRLNGDSEAFIKTSRELDVLPPLVTFMIEAMMTPLLNAMRTRLGELVPVQGWERGSCPMCGSLPTMAWLAPKENHDLESLVGGGGQKYLHCSLCGHDWRYRRDACPACDNEDQQTREVLYAEDNRRERIEACSKCGTYLVSLDLREYESAPHLSVAPIGFVHLDIIAKQKRYAPLSPSIWNGVEE